jgi:hypothetical protein
MITKKGRRERKGCEDGSECKQELEKKWRWRVQGNKVVLYRSRACHIQKSITPQKVTGFSLRTLVVIFFVAMIQFLYQVKCLMKIHVFRDVTTCRLVNTYRRFERLYCLHLQRQVVSVCCLLVNTI